MGKYLNGQKEINYEDSSSSLINFIDGYPDGEWVFKDTDGTVFRNSDFKRGVKDGYDTYYYANGNKRLVAKYVKGLQHGKQEMYYHTGIVGGVFYCKEGKKHGIETWYTEYDKSIIKYKAYYLENEQVDSLVYFNSVKNRLNFTM